MKFLPHFILFLLIVMGITVAAAAFSDEGGSAAAHPKFSSMVVGGERAIQDTAISVYGWVFVSLMLLLFVAILLLGCHKSRPPSGLLVSFTIGFLICVGVFGKMWLTYQKLGRDVIGATAVDSVSDDRVSAAKSVDSTSLLGPFPPPTTWMLFGVAFAPLSFMVVYMFGFHRWLGDPDSIQGSTK